jgi:hypothetical protein
MSEAMANFKDGELVVATRDIIAEATGDHPEQLLASKGDLLQIYDAAFETDFPWVVKRHSDGRIFSVKSHEIKYPEQKMVGNTIQDVLQIAQAVLTALNVGDVKSGSPLHLKLSEVMIAYRVDQDVLKGSYGTD